MNMRACRRYIAILGIGSALWISTAQAFLCFSENSHNRYRDNYFSPPPPIGAFVYGEPPVPYYMIPVMRQGLIAPAEIRSSDYPALDPPVAPIELPETDYPVQDAVLPEQHIFH
jgi:hypothetical protein